MPELVTIPISYFEFVVEYERPEWRFLADRASQMEALFDALKPWNPNIDDVEFLNSGKTSEQGVNLKLPLKRVSFFFGAASFRFTRHNVDWQSSDETIQILDSAFASLLRLFSIKIATQKAEVGMHIQPRSLTFVDILRPLIAPPLATLESEPLLTLAAVGKWNNRRVTVDGSAAIANGVFLRLERDFPVTTSYEEISQQLRNDQMNLFAVLGVEEDRT